VQPAYACVTDEQFVQAGEESEEVDSDCVNDTGGYEYMVRTTLSPFTGNFQEQ
jgi:hypothetical protein